MPRVRIRATVRIVLPVMVGTVAAWAALAQEPPPGVPVRPANVYPPPATYEEWRDDIPVLCEPLIPAAARYAEWEAWWSRQQVFGGLSRPAGYWSVRPDTRDRGGSYAARYLEECRRSGETIIPYVERGWWPPQQVFFIVAIAAPLPNVEALIRGELVSGDVPGEEVAIAIRAYRAARQAAYERAAAGKAGHPTFTYAEWKHPDPAGEPLLWDHDEPLEVRRQRNAEWWARMGAFAALPEPMNYAVLRPNRAVPESIYHDRFLTDARRGGDIIIPFIDRRLDEPEQVYLVVAAGAPVEAVEALIRGQLRQGLVPDEEIAVTVQAYLAAPVPGL